jgi:hypothetical protein
MEPRADPVPRGGRDPPIRSGGLLSCLRRHPIVCLAVLTPGIPEYLSSSSSLLNLFVNPVWFFLQLAINVGQYTAGALLVREALIRWRKGWPTAILLALAYGITEEGLGDNTLFNSLQGRDGVLGHFGRFLGVNWIWSAGVLTFHVVYSIGLPILLLGLALPKTRGRSLLGHRGIAVAFLTLGLSTATETVLVFEGTGFWMGESLFVGSVLAIVALVLAGRSVPTPDPFPPTAGGGVGSWPVGLLGFAIFPGVFLIEYGFTAQPGAAPLVLGIELVFLVGVALLVRRALRRAGVEYGLVTLAFGLVLWQALFGALLTLPFPYPILLAVVAVAFFVRLRRAYDPARRGS